MQYIYFLNATACITNVFAAPCWWPAVFFLPPPEETWFDCFKSTQIWTKTSQQPKVLFKTTRSLFLLCAQIASASSVNVKKRATGLSYSIDFS